MENASGSFLDINALKSVENIRRVISQYRTEQEEIFNKMTQESTKHIQIRDQNIERICDYSCLISVSRKLSSQTGAWPVALVGSLSNKSVGLGGFESNGSLWRFVKTDDTHGLRVVIECAEIGEKVMYLTQSLELSENNSYAAEWVVTQMAVEKGSNDLRVTLRSVEDRRLLCCNEEAGVALLAEEEVKQPDDSPHVSYWSTEWTILAEDMLPGMYGDELKFLDDELNMAE